MKDRINLTNDEKFASHVLGSSDHINFSMAKDINKMIADEKKAKFNDQIDTYKEELDQQYSRVEKYQDEVKERLCDLAIMPLYDRILVKPFVDNPFQKITIENGIITDIGGLNPNIEFNNDTGEFQERNQNIIVATVVEVGPECKYVKEGDAVMYMKHIPTPVPFFKQGFWTLKEENVIAVVGYGLHERLK